MSRAGKSGPCRNEPGFLGEISEREFSEDAARAVLEDYHGMLLEFCNRLRSNRHDAEDLSQKVVVAGWRWMMAYRVLPDRPAPWLRRIATNLNINDHRKARKRPTVALTETIAASVYDPTESAYDRFVANELGPEMAEALSQINPDYAQAFVLVYGEGMQYAEAAALLEVEVGTVKSRLSRAREGLRKILGAT